MLLAWNGILWQHQRRNPKSFTHLIIRLDFAAVGKFSRDLWSRGGSWSSLFFCSQLCEIFFIFSSSFPESKEQINVCLARCAVRIFFQVAKGHFYNMLKTNLDNDCTSSSFVFWLFFARVKTLSNSESWKFSLGTNILFENYSKCRIFSILAFFTNFCHT